MINLALPESQSTHGRQLMQVYSALKDVLQGLKAVYIETKDSITLLIWWTTLIQPTTKIRDRWPEHFGSVLNHQHSVDGLHSGYW